MSSVNFDDILAPSDGIPVPNDQGNKNIAYGVGQCTFRSATPGATYYFKIFPYKGTGDIINYKTNGDIQQVVININ
jgi:hypothetical protein